MKFRRARISLASSQIIMNVPATGQEIEEAAQLRQSLEASDTF